MMRHMSRSTAWQLARQGLAMTQDAISRRCLGTGAGGMVCWADKRGDWPLRLLQAEAPPRGVFLRPQTLRTFADAKGRAMCYCSRNS